MVTKTIVIQNKLGMHMRPVQKFVKMATAYPCTVELINKGHIIDAKSIMNLLAACIKSGDSVELRCTGDREQEALTALAELAESRFGEA